jgi:hypothetical protein
VRTTKAVKLLFVILKDVSDVAEHDPVLVPVLQIVGHGHHPFRLGKHQAVLHVLDVAIHNFSQILLLVKFTMINLQIYKAFL